MRPSHANSGFTLVELSIVLVIIGLIIGGILVGRDLIDAANVRAQITQIEQYKAAVNTFKAKYNYLPGDIPSAVASAFGLLTRAGTTGEGDGNWFIGTSTGGPSAWQGNETILFWRDLATVGLISGQFTMTSSGQRAGQVNADRTPVGVVPPSPLSNKGYVFAFSYTVPGGGYTACSGGDVYFCFALYGIISFSSGGDFRVSQGGVGPSYVVTPQQAYSMDTKMDDGFPRTGSVQSGENDGNYSLSARTAGNTCNVSGGGAYVVSGSTATCMVDFLFK